MVTETLVDIYCTQAEVERIYFSSVGATSTMEDLSAADQATLWTEMIAEATDYINQYALTIYDSDDMKTNRWVVSRACIITAYFMSSRRGNPGIFVDRFNRVTRELELVARGALVIPRLAMRSDFTPAMSNFHMDDRFAVNKVRVHQTISTGGTSGRQHLSPVYPYEWL